MNIPSYVYQNGFGIYYFRIAIPKHLKAAIGKHEIRKSLKTTNHHYALKQARRFAVIAEQLFQTGIRDIKHINSAFQKGKDHPVISLDAPMIGYSDTFGYSNNHGALQGGIQAASEQPQVVTSIKLIQLIDQYVHCQEIENSWQEKTTAENKAIFDTLIEIVGDIDLTEINHQTADNYRATLKRLPPNMNKSPSYRNKSVKQILTMNPKVTLSDTSVNKYMRRISAMFNWSVDRDLVAKNFFRKKPIQESKKANERRDMLTSDDLAAIFNPNRFHAEADKPFKFWIPLSGLYAGARLNEISQLDSQDIKQIHGIWCFRFLTAKQKKYSERIVPIHSRLLDLGLVEYASRQSGKLFRELRERRDGYGHEVSKWYARYRRKCGISDTRNRDFHSMRHTFSTKLFRMGVNPTLISELDGHVTGNGKRRTTTEEVYIKPSEVYVLKEAIEKLDYGEPLQKVLPYREVLTQRL
jgi:integrase